MSDTYLFISPAKNLGLVDAKVTPIDRDWRRLKFAYRLTDRT